MSKRNQITRVFSVCETCPELKEVLCYSTPFYLCKAFGTLYDGYLESERGKSEYVKYYVPDNCVRIMEQTVLNQ